MKILCVHQGYELYGSDKTFVQSVKAMRERYPNAYIKVLLPKDGALTSYLSPYADHIDYRALWILRKSNVRSLFGVGFFRLVRESINAYRLMKAFDFIYINTAVVLNFLLASFFVSNPRVVHVHEIPKGIARVVFSGLLAWTRAFLVYNSNATKHAYSVPNWQQSLVIMNGVPKPHSNNFDVRSTQSMELKILMMGRINSWKGQDLLLHAIGELDENRKNRIKLKIVGDVFESQYHYKKNLEEIVLATGIEHIVDFVGFEKETKPIYQWADVVVVPSKEPEPFGLVAIEAMSYGKCVIAANHGGLVDIVEDNKTGYLFTPNDVNSLRDVISIAIDDQKKLIKMGESGYTRFEQCFSEDTYMHSIAELIAECGVEEK